MFLVTLLYALFASVFIVGKSALEYASPLFIVGSRMTVAGLGMILYLFLFKRDQFKIPKTAWKRLILLGICNIYLVNALEFWGLKYLTSFKTCFIYSLSPFVTALLSYFIFKEGLSIKKWLGLAVGFLGFIPILLHSTGAEEALGQLWVFSWPELFVIGAAVLSCFGWILLRRLVREDGCSFVVSNGISMFLGGLIALAHSYIAEPWDPLPVVSMGPFLETALMLLLISNLLAYNLYGFLLKRYTATFITFAGFTTPIFTALLGWFFLGESIHMPFIVSTSIVFMGLFLFYQEELKEGYRLKTQKA